MLCILNVFFCISSCYRVALRLVKCKCHFCFDQESPEGYKDLTGSFVTILKQVVGGKLPIDFNYHNVPAPWLQIQLLRILSQLGRDDQRYRWPDSDFTNPLNSSKVIDLNLFTVFILNIQFCFYVFSTSELMYEVLDESLRRAEMNHNITYGNLSL